MSDTRNSLVILIPAILVFSIIFITGIFFLSTPNSKEAIYYEDFKLQIIAQDRSKIYSTASGKMRLLGYNPGNNLNSNKKVTDLNYSKSNHQIFMFFSTTEGHDCYRANVAVFNPDLIETANNDLQKFKSSLIDELKNTVIKLREDNCAF